MKLIKDIITSSQTDESRRVESAFREAQYLEEALRKRIEIN